MGRKMATYMYLRLPLHLLLPMLTNAYLNTVMPTGTCTIDPADGLKVPNPEQENTHRISTAWNPHYGTHVIVMGRDTRIYHKHQTAPTPDSNFTGWKCLTPDFTKVPCSSAPTCGGYDNSPAIMWQPKNGTLVVMVRQMDDLTIHEMHLEDASDPDSWSELRGPACLCNFPPCTNQTRCGAVSECDNTGPDCTKIPASSRHFWNTSPPFPTSELTLLPEGDRLSMYYRGFDGGYYKTMQLVAGDTAGKWGPFHPLGGLNDAVNNTIE